MIPVGDYRITVVATAHHAVQFIATLWAHFTIPQLTISIECQTKRIAMTQRPYLRRDAALIRKRVVSRHAAIIIQAQDLAQVHGHVLGRIEFLALAGTDP